MIGKLIVDLVDLLEGKGVGFYDATLCFNDDGGIDVWV